MSLDSWYCAHRIKELTTEIELLKDRIDRMGSIHKKARREFDEQEINEHIDDLKQQRCYFYKERYENYTRKQPVKTKLDLPDFCFNHKKVEKYIKGII